MNTLLLAIFDVLFYDTSKIACTAARLNKAGNMITRDLSETTLLLMLYQFLKIFLMLIKLRKHLLLYLW